MFGPGVRCDGSSVNRGLLCPGLADELVGGKAAQGLEATAVIVGIDEELQVTPELIVAAIVVALDGCVFDGPVHPLDLPVCPRAARLGQAVLDPVLLAGMREGVDEIDARLLASRPVRLGGSLGVRVGGRRVDELRAVVGQHGVDRVGHGCHKGAQEVRSDPAGCSLVQSSEGELARAIDGHEQGEPALLRVHLGDVDVEVADRVGLEAGALGLVALGVGQPSDAVALEAAVQARAPQVRDGGLEGVEAVVQRQERVPPEGDDDRLLLKRQHRRADLLRPHARIGGGPALAPLLHGGGADAVALGERPHALLTSLDCATDRLCRRGAAVENLAHNASRSAWPNVPPQRGTKHLAPARVPAATAGSTPETGGRVPRAAPAKPERRSAAPGSRRVASAAGMRH